MELSYQREVPVLYPDVRVSKVGKEKVEQRFCVCVKVAVYVREVLGSGLT